MSRREGSIPRDMDGQTSAPGSVPTGRAPLDPPSARPRRMITMADALILTAAFISFLFSVGLWFGLFGGAPDRETGLFVGIWVPSILSAGAYFKLAAGGGRHG